MGKKIHKDKKHGEIIQAQVWTPPLVWQALKVKAALNDQSMKAFMIELLTEAAAEGLALLEQRKGE